MYSRVRHAPCEKPSSAIRARGARRPGRWARRDSMRRRAESRYGWFASSGARNEYAYSFLAPLEANQPYLDSALRRIESLRAHLPGRRAPRARVAILGFSQGACLALEYAARHPRRYGAVIGLTGGLVGPPGTPRDYPGSLDGTPVFLGTSDPDPHVPFARVRETEAVLARMGAAVELRRYPGMPHTVNQDELDATRSLLERVLSRGKGEHS